MLISIFFLLIMQTIRILSNFFQIMVLVEILLIFSPHIIFFFLSEIIQLKWLYTKSGTPLVEYSGQLLFVYGMWCHLKIGKLIF